MPPTFLRRLLIAAWLVPIVLVPVAYGENLTGNHGAVKDFAALTAATVAGALGLLAWQPRRRSELDADPTHVYSTLAMLFVWSSITLFWHSSRWTSGGPLSTWPILAAGSFGLSLLLGSTEARRTLLVAYGVAVVIAAVAYLRLYGGTPWGPGHHFPFGNPNIGASFLLGPAVAASVLCVDFRLRRHGPGTALSLLVAGVAWAAIARSEAKGAWVGGFVATVPGILFVTRGLARRIALGVGVAALALAALALTFHEDRAKDLSDSMAVRLQMWRGTWALIEESPLTLLAGHGTGSFFAEYPRFAPLDAEANPEWAPIDDFPHDFVLHLWSESGVAGVLLLGVFAGAVGAAVLSGRRHREDPLDRAVLCAAGAALAALFVHSLVDVALHHAPVQWQAAIALALVAALGRGPSASSGGDPGEPMPRRVLQLSAGVRWSAAACLVALWGTSALGTLRSELAAHRAHEAEAVAHTQVARGRMAEARTAFETAVSTYDEALLESPWEGYRTIRIRVDRWNVLMAFAEADTERTTALAKQAYRSIDEVAHRDRGLLRSWGLGDLFLAEAALRAGDSPRAAEHLRRGSGRRPAQWRYYWCYWQSRTDFPPGLERELARNAEKGLEIAPDSFPLVATHALLASLRDAARAAPLLARALELGEAERIDAQSVADRPEYRKLLETVRGLAPPTSRR